MILHLPFAYIIKILPRYVALILFNASTSSLLSTVRKIDLTHLFFAFISLDIRPSSLTVKYLGLTLNRCLTWARYLSEKRLSLNNQLRMLKHLIGNKVIPISPI